MTKTSAHEDQRRERLDHDRRQAVAHRHPVLVEGDEHRVVEHEQDPADDNEADDPGERGDLEPQQRRCWPARQRRRRLSTPRRAGAAGSAGGAGADTAAAGAAAPSSAAASAPGPSRAARRCRERNPVRSSAHASLSAPDRDLDTICAAMKFTSMVIANSARPAAISALIAKWLEASEYCERDEAGDRAGAVLQDVRLDGEDRRDDQQHGDRLAERPAEAEHQCRRSWRPGRTAGRPTRIIPQRVRAEGERALALADRRLAERLAHDRARRSA